MTSRSVKTDKSLLDLDHCHDPLIINGFDCSLKHDWITIAGTRNDQTLKCCLLRRLSYIIRFCPKSAVKIMDPSLVNCIQTFNVVKFLFFEN